MNADPNVIIAIFVLVVAPTLIALSIPVLSWLEGRVDQIPNLLDN